MKQLRRILMCVDPQRTPPGVIDRIADLAQKKGAAVKLLHVVTGYPEDLSEWWNVRNPKKLHDQIVEERESYLGKLTERLRERGVQDVTYSLRWGNRFTEINKEAMSGHYDLVILTPQYQHPGTLQKLLHECPSVDLIRHCPCTLWIAKGNLVGASRAVAVAVDWKKDQKECDPFTAKILDTAAAVAEADGATLHLVHALPRYGVKALEDEKHHKDLTNHIDVLRKQMEEQCNPILSDYGLTLADRQVHLLTGAPAEVIPDFVRDHGIELIIVGTVGRSGIPGLLVGNIAERVFEKVDCDVIAVKPDQFVSVFELGLADQKQTEKEERLVSLEETLKERTKELELLEQELEEKKRKLDKGG